jgi:hypothetical protein
MSGPDPVARERERLIFGAGFAFGVMFTLLILGVVLSTVVPGPVTLGTLLTSAVLLPVVAAIVFAAIVGVALYVLALPESGVGLPQQPFIGEPNTEPPDIDTETPEVDTE